MVMLGTICCAGGILIDVTKKLRIVDGDGATVRVQTFAHSYNASLQGRGNILRYCSPHDDHNKFHHVHRFDVWGGDHQGSVDEVSADDWPTLGDVLHGLQRWSREHADRLA